MQPNTYSVECKASVSTGSEARCVGMVSAKLHLIGTFVGTIVVQGRIGSDWVDLFTIVGSGSVSEIMDIEPSYYAIRTSTTAYTSGSLTGTLHGLFAHN